MKKLLSLILALSMLMSVGLTSCGKKDENIKKKENKTEAITTEKAHGKCKNGKNHAFTTTIAEEDCTSRGYTLNTCKDCGYSYLSNTNAALGHDFGDEETVIMLGCTSDGTVKQTCKRCGMSSEYSLPHTGHSYELSGEEGPDGNIYVCTLCGDTVTLGEDETLPEEMEDSLYLPDRPCNFSFAVLCESEDVLRDSLTLSGHKGNVDYKATPDGDGKYLISPKKSYDEYCNYTAVLTDSASFENYNTQTLEFSIVGPERADVEFKDEDIVFLKKLSENNKGYSTESVEWDEAAERYYVTLSGNVDFKDSYVGKIIAVGDYTSTEEIIKDPTQELTFGKLMGVTHNAKGKTVLEMSAPDISDVFSEYNVYFSGGVDDTETLELLASDEELELEFAEAVVMSDGFAEYMATVQLAAGDYADSHGLEVVPLGAKDDDNKFEFKLEKPKLDKLPGGNGGHLWLKGSVSYKIDLKEKDNKSFAGSVVVTCSAEINSDITFGGQFEDEKKVDLYVTNASTTSLEFNVEFKMNYSAKYEEKFYVHKTTQKIHTSSCRIATEQTESTNLVSYNATELAELFGGDKEAMKNSECKACRAVTGLDGTAYVYSTETGKLHCMNCMHVNTIKGCNVYTVYPDNTLKYDNCKTCKPEERQSKDFEARMINKLYGADMADEVNAFKKTTEEIFGKSKLDNKDKPGKSLTVNVAGAFNIELGIQPVFELDIDASVNFKVTAYSTSTVGIRSRGGKNDGYETYKVDESADVTYDLNFMGEAKAKLGISLSVMAYPVGFDKVAHINITGNLGVYGHLTGAIGVSGELGGDSDAYCGARLEVGIYYDLGGYWKLLWFDNNFSIIENTEVPLKKWGYDRVYYSYEDNSPEVDMSDSFYLKLSDFTSTKYLDLDTLEEKTGKITIFDKSKVKLKIDIKNEDGTPCDHMYFIDDTWTFMKKYNAPKNFTAYIHINVEPVKEINSFDDFINSSNKKPQYGYFLDELVVKVNVGTRQLTPEEAVKIYLDNREVWEFTDNTVNSAMYGCGYLFVDIDFDGILELVSTYCSGTARYAYNRFFRINSHSNTVEEIKTNYNELQSNFTMSGGIFGEIDLGNGNLAYHVKAIIAISFSNGIEYDGLLYYEDGKIHEEYSVGKYLGENAGNYIIKSSDGTWIDVSQYEYSQAYKKLIKDREVEVDKNISSLVEARNYIKLSTEEKYQLLLETYKDALTSKEPIDNTSPKISLEDISIVSHDSYKDNEGDSTIFNLGGDGLTQCDDGKTFKRYGNIGVDGTKFSDGFEVWIARWNYADEISWASATFDLNGRYRVLTGKTNLIKSYNTTNFDTTVYFYDGNKLLASYRLTDTDYKKDISVDVTGVNHLRLYVKDNVAACGGTSLALYDMFLDSTSSPDNSGNTNTIIPSSAFVKDVISAGDYHTVGLKSNGTVVAVGDNSDGQCNVESWNNIIAVSAGSDHTVGLKSDGTVVAVGDNAMYKQCNVSSWQNIVAIDAGYKHTVGLRSDGTVVAVGYNYYGQCNVSSWKDITSVCAGSGYTVGLKSDGTIVVAGYLDQIEILSWSDIIEISCAGDHIVGLKSNGTVVAVGDNNFGQCNVKSWENIVSIDAGWFHPIPGDATSYTIGLKSDGTVVATGGNHYGQCDVENWDNIISISSGDWHTIGLKSDGTVVSTGRNIYGECDVSSWRDIALPTT